MTITKSDVKEYQKLCLEKFGEEPDYQTAFEQLSKLVRQVEIVYQPIKKADLDTLIDTDKHKH